MVVLIDGKKVSQKVIDNIKSEISSNSYKPTLAVIIVGSNPASKIYVKRKHEKAIEVGMNSITIEFEESIAQSILEQKIAELNSDSSINGILVQLPLPKHINTYEILQQIKPEKDVDGFHPENIGKLAIGLKPYALPCTPFGVMKLLEEYNIEPEGKNVVIIGRSNIVGKPISYLFLNKNATVTICHSKTRDIASATSQADIVVAAVGIAKFVKAEWVKEDAVVIDVGINRTPEGKLVGDVDFENVKEKASYITPVPGGVGPMTIAMLLSNTLDLYKIQNKEII